MTKMADPTLDQILFPSQYFDDNASALSRVLGDLKRASLSIPNRLRSICADAEFVAAVADALGDLPLVANERCGSWYIDPKMKEASAYFKSTDGHTGQWKFSTRRLNLHLLWVIGIRGGCIIVDSTRRGKRMPDALSKTIPVWCAVLNRVLFPDQPEVHSLFTSPSAVSASEASQIEAILPDFVEAFNSLAIDTAPLRQHLRKPLRPFWITHSDFDDGIDLETVADAVREIRKAWHPVVCCTSSRRVEGGEMTVSVGDKGYVYVQGAGDDTENWARGLTAAVFWRHRETLLAAEEGELPGLIEKLLREEKKEEAGKDERLDIKGVAPRVWVGTLASLERARDLDGACVIALAPKATEQETWVKSPSYMEVGLGKNSKTASRLLRDALPRICEFAGQFLTAGEQSEDSEPNALPKGAGQEDKRVVILCETGKDLSVGVALAIYCWCYDDAGKVRSESDSRNGFTKTAVRVKLGHIVQAAPEANPSRATLQSVNSFLMDWRR